MAKREGADALAPPRERGTVNETLVRVGRQDVDPEGVTLPVGVQLLASSSDRLLLETPTRLPAGAEVRFGLNYSALLRATTSPFVAERLVHASAPQGAVAGNAGPGRGPNSSQRDPWRGFKYRARATVLERAGGRCEGSVLLAWGRCADAAVEVVYVFPYSKGGPTVVSNGQALCRDHNRRINPPWWYVRVSAAALDYRYNES